MCFKRLKLKFLLIVKRIFGIKVHMVETKIPTVEKQENHECIAIEKPNADGPSSAEEFFLPDAREAQFFVENVTDSNDPEEDILVYAPELYDRK